MIGSILLVDRFAVREPALSPISRQRGAVKPPSHSHNQADYLRIVVIS